MLQNVRRSGISMRNKWLTILKSSSDGLQRMPSKSLSDSGFAEFSCLTTRRSLMADFSKRVAHQDAAGKPILSREQWGNRHALFYQLPFQLSRSSGETLRTSQFARCFASKTTESGQKGSGARKEISAVEDPFDAPTYNIPEKPVTFTEGASYSLVILAGLGIAAAAAYGVFNELILQPKEYKIFNKALDRIQNDSQVRVRVGSPITGYGSESRNRAARQRIPHKTWTDEDGVEHIVVNFHIRGPQGAGKVYTEMFKDKVDKQWKFMYLIVEVTSPSPAQLMLESYVPV